MTKRDDIFIRRVGLLSIVLLAFFLSGCILTTENATVQPVLTQTVAAGDVENGRDIFMGYTHFQNNGPPCMACHSVGENGLLGGGAMGPDLTNLTSRRSQAEIISILQNSGPTISPAMKPIYTEHPLTGSEQADLVAFMGASNGEPETSREWVIIGISLAGFAAVVVGLGIIYRGRLRGVRRPLVKKAHKELP